MPPAQTIKQAKASFAARGRPSLTAKEQRQLARSVELEQRAGRVKEQAKRKAAAAKKRAENDAQEKRERDVRLGTQRRKDRFGYVSSQFHLGAFLVGGAGRKGGVVEGMDVDVLEEDADEDLFGDEGLDDEVMLNVLVEKADEHAEAVDMPPPRLVLPNCRGSETAQVIEEIGDFWDDLESSTQIARELSGSEERVEVELNGTGKSTSTRSASFGSVDFDLTAEDLDQLDPPSGVLKVLPLARDERLPLPLPEKQTITRPPPGIGEAVMSPPAPPTREMKRTSTPPPRPPQKPSTTTIQAPQSRETKKTTKEPQSREMNITIPRPKPLTVMPPPAESSTKSVTFNLTASESSTITTPPPRNESIAMPPPALKRFHDSTLQQTKSRNAIKGPFLPASSLYCSPDLGFTLTQLESFVDDDIQLTQAVPG